MALSNATTQRHPAREPVRQFSVFLENRVGALLDVVKLLNQHMVDVIALTVQDAADSSIVRIIVSDPDLVETVFEDHGIAYAIIDMLIVELPESAEQLGRVLSTLLQAEVNIHFSYPLLTRPRGRAALALHVEDDDYAGNVLSRSGFQLLTQADISR